MNRPWELVSTNSIDILDVLGSNIRIDSYGSQIKRILPLKNDEVNREYISNRVRFFFDGLNRWRIITPILKNKQDFLFSSWSLVFPNIFLKLIQNIEKKKNLGFFLNSFVDLNTIYLTKIISNVNGFFVLKSNHLNLSDYYNFYINPNFLNLLKKKKVIIFIGSLLRLESPVLNIRFRLNLLNKQTLFLNCGSNRWDNLNTLSLGLNTKNLLLFLQGKHKLCSLVLKNLLANNIIHNNLGFIVGSGGLNRCDNSRLLKIIDFFSVKFKVLKKNIKKSNKLFPYKFKKGLINTNVFQIIPNSLNKILFNEFNIFNTYFLEKDLDIRYYLGLNNNIKKNNNQLTIFQGHHTSYSNLKNIDVILPSLNFFEKRNSYLNIEGLLQETNISIVNTANSKSDWIILNSFFRYISEVIFIHYNFLLSLNIKYVELKRLKDNYFNFQYYKKLFLKKNSINLFWKKLSKFNYYKFNYNYRLNFNLSEVITLYNSIFSSFLISPYTLDVVSKNSKWMSQSEIIFKKDFNNFLKF